MKLIKTFLQGAVVVFFLTLALFISPSKVSAHCDTLDGPVVNAARKALETENVNYVLIWVKPENEDEIKKALKRARDKRKQAKTKEEKNEADMELFETLVKVHREGEGAKYEGIKPAGSVEPEIALADRAVETGELKEVLNRITSEHAKEVVTYLFHQVKEKSGYQVDNVSSGRRFIEAYVRFIHTVEKAVKGQEISEEKYHH